MRDRQASSIGRRRFLMAAGGLGATGLAAGVVPGRNAGADAPVEHGARVEPFHGPHQGGILTAPQDHLYFAAFDVVTDSLAKVVALMQAWSEAAQRMSIGETAKALTSDPDLPAADSGEAIGLGPARLTITFGFGPGLFAKDGVDRFGLAARRPEALVDLPKFVGDQLVPERSGGDLAIQACADDPQVAFHAVRALAQIGVGVVKLRWAQTGYARNSAGKGTPRNLMGFKDGTNNPSTSDPAAMDKIVWAGAEGSAWMQGGTYAVVRRIRITLEHWDRMEVGFQEQVVGRRKSSGAPLSGNGEFDALDLQATDPDGNPAIPDTAHVRLAAAETNGGAQILRHGYSYNDGANFYVERWPPWRQGPEYDAGLFFVAFQKDPRTGFIPVFKRVSAMDSMNQFVTHIGGGIFACPPGVMPGQFIGEALFAGVVQPRMTSGAQQQPAAPAQPWTSGGETY
jgi:deferrochelatase/peroxidase EfeB